MLKSTISATVVVIMLAGSASAFGGKGGDGGDASASASAAAAAAASASAYQKQGQAQGQYQSQANRNTNRNQQSTEVNVDTPSFTTGIHANIGSANNAPCGRVFLGVPYSGENCTDRMETAKIGDIVERLHSGSAAVRAGAQAEMLTWASTDKTARRAFRLLGLIK